MGTRARNRGFALAGYLVALGVIAVAGWLIKPELFPGGSRRAAQSTQATAKVEQAANAQGASAAASVAKIGEANAEAPASPSRDFITREIPVALSRLPAPDPLALLAAEQRRSAVMEGRADEARRLYEAAAKKSEALQRERDEAFAARRAADLALEKSAAAEHARTVQLFGAGLLAAVALAGFAWVKIYHVSPATIGLIAADIRGGTGAIQAITENLAPRQFASVERAAKLAAPLAPAP